MEKYDHLVKILILGDKNVGKTSLTKLFTNNTFINIHGSTVGIDFYTKQIDLTIDSETRRVKIQLWDTSAEEKYKLILTTYYKAVNGVILVYDITDKSSFENIIDVLKEILFFKNIPILILGNKSDLDASRKVFNSDLETIKNVKEVSIMKPETFILALQEFVSKIILTSKPLNFYKDDILNHNDNNCNI